ncbi:MAG: GntR family transcriptional regulator [Bacteroidia bacterium]|nr:GntR family transcriptional regulator [Bacteroidia bacterium]
MIEIGKTNTLSILRETDVGLFLGDTEGNEVLLPKSRLEGEYKLNSKLEVFVYTDSDSRLIASVKKPIVQLNEFALLRVKSVTEFGAFMDWGLEKDLFVAYNEQKYDFLEGKFYVVYVYLDDVSKRIAGSNKLDKFLITEDVKLEGGAEVDIMIVEESQLGFSCIINGLYKGLIYHNDVFQDLFIGDELEAYVKTIRPDGLIDISLQKSGFKNVLSATEIVMEYLENNGGFLNLHDKSSPEEIAAKFSMSKATYKKAIGILYRHRKVLIKPDGVYLVVKEPGAEDANIIDAE